MQLSYFWINTGLLSEREIPGDDKILGDRWESLSEGINHCCWKREVWGQSIKNIFYMDVRCCPLNNIHCFWTVVLEKTLESPLDCKEIQPVHSKWNQSWVFIAKTDVEAEAPILWPPDVKNWLIWENPNAGKDWRQEEKWTTEEDMVGWHHRLNGHEFE